MILGGTVQAVWKHVGVVWRLKIVPFLTEVVLVAAWKDTQEIHVMVRFGIQNKHEAVSIITYENLYPPIISQFIDI